MRAPTFWWEPRPTLLARLLQPLAVAYGEATARRMRQDGTRLAVPVLCVGNLVAGGAGKTPTALALAGLLSGQGHRPAFLSRGYGRTRGRAEAGDRVIRVEPERHLAVDVGDEPLLLARVAPTYVSGDRLAAGRQAIAGGASLLILDDGLQNPSPHKTLTLAVVDGGAGVGNGLCLPAGPLRAPLDAQWPHVSALCVIGPGAEGERCIAAARVRAIPVWTARIVPDEAALTDLRDRPLYAFAGIGRPAKFFETLIAHDLDVVGTRSFPDHHAFTAADLARLERDARALGATLVTTAKDHARLPAGFPARPLPVTLRFDDEDEFLTWVSAMIGGSG